MVIETTSLKVSEIIDGPSKSDLYPALFEHKQIRFTGEQCVFLVTVHTLTNPLGQTTNEERWIIEGVIDQDLDPQSFEPVANAANQTVAGLARQFRCNFSTSTRKGMFGELSDLASK